MEEWTTIDRKVSKKKTSRDENKEEGDGWEQVGWHIRQLLLIADNLDVF